MQKRNRWIMVILVIASLLLAACASNPPEGDGADEGVSPAQVEHLSGVNPTRITLTEEAAERLDIQLAEVPNQDVDGTQFKIVPYAAVLYDSQGATWLYSSSESLTFLRNPIVVDTIKGGVAFLKEGPPAGTAVVTIGAAELFGSEEEFEEE